jgi:hypothetical protein
MVCVNLAILEVSVLSIQFRETDNSLCPLGYQDSGADIAYVLQEHANILVVTPTASPDPNSAEGWCFPDTEDGILSAINRGATHLWANTILFASRPLQTSRLLTDHEDHIRVVGQPPNLVELFDDKAYLNDCIRQKKYVTMPRGWTIDSRQCIHAVMNSSGVTYPIVAKPVRGRGSHGVKVCYSKETLHDHVRLLLLQSSNVLLEKFLPGAEGTVTVMPSSDSRPSYWAMPIAIRFNHLDDIAPYNGVITVTVNSRVVTTKEYSEDPRYAVAQRQCEKVAELLEVTAPIRIDIRRVSSDEKAEFALFDINMKPVRQIYRFMNFRILRISSGLTSVRSRT